MSTIQIRIDDKTKRAAKKVLDTLGIDMSSAIKLYLNQISIRNAIPFQILTENGLTFEQEIEILKASEEAKRGINVTRTTNAREMKEYLDSLKSKK